MVTVDTLGSGNSLTVSILCLVPLPCLLASVAEHIIHQTTTLVSTFTRVGTLPPYRTNGAINDFREVGLVGVMGHHQYNHLSGGHGEMGNPGGRPTLF